MFSLPVPKMNVRRDGRPPPGGTEPKRETTEDRLLDAVERKQHKAGVAFGASVLGERPTLERTSNGSAKFSRVAWQVAEGLKSREGRKLRSMRDLLKDDEGNDAGGNENIFDLAAVEGDDGDIIATHTDNLIESAEAVNQLFQDDGGSIGSELSANSNDESLPLTENMPQGEYGATQRKKRHRKKSRKRFQYLCCLKLKRLGLTEAVNPLSIMKGLWHFAVASMFTYVSLPALFCAAVLYYHLGNPEVDVLPGDGTLSWWCLFLTRQAITFEIASALQYFIVEGLALRSRWFVGLFGPLVTLGLIQAKGWPLVSVLWSFTNLALLHGNNPFQKNWLWYSEVSLFSPDNSGADFLNSEFYLGVLLSMLLAGSAHGVKRTSLALSFGRRTLLAYKDRLEKILSDIVIITEVADLATVLESMDAVDQAQSTRFRASPVTTTNKWKDNLEVKYKHKRVKTMDLLPPTDEIGKAAFQTVSEPSFDDSIDDELDGEDDDDDDDDNDDENEDDEEDGDDACDSTEEVVDGISNLEPVKENGSVRNSLGAGISETGSRATKNTTSRSALKRQLDHWREPGTRTDKLDEISIGDILKFRKALTFMDDRFPFGSSFGLVKSRNDCIKCAQFLYRKLVKARDTTTPLNYETISLLAINQDNSIDEVKEMALQGLFRPDIDNKLTVLAFIQACDSVYKRIRFFRASVANSSVINSVLEGIIDSVFNFILALVIMTILNFNPYPLLVSLSSLMVSFAFALGSSASKYIEGVMLIAIRRPFDIGDRIILESTSQSYSNAEPTWFVEDINLWSTVLRFAATNEVASINNSSLSTLRIINCNRSANALITIDFKLDMVSATPERTKEMRIEMELYVRDRPRIFESLVFFYCKHIETENECYIYTLRARHRLSWQNYSVIIKDVAEMKLHCKEVGQKIGINYVKFVPSVRVLTADGEHSGHDSEGAAAADHVLNSLKVSPTKNM